MEKRSVKYFQFYKTAVLTHTVHEYNYNLYRIIKVIFYSKLSHLRVYTSSFYTICKEPLYAPVVRLAPKCCHGYQWQLFTFNLKEDSSIFINSKKCI